MTDKNKVFFPLRTSVELFEDRNSPEAVTRAKQAAVLYDELIFETGLYRVSITPEGSSGWLTPPSSFTPELLKDSRRVQEPGTGFGISVGFEGESEMLPVFEAPLSVSFAAEFHTGILDDLEEFEPEWIKTVDLPNTFPASHPVGRIARERNLRDRSDEELMPDLRGKETFLRNHICASFNRDSVVAASLGASFNLTSLFRPMLQRHTFHNDWSGSEALRILVRNLGSLPWEAVVEFREHPGSQEARMKLREFEELAAQEEPQDAYNFLARVSQEVTDSLLSAWQSLRPSLPEELAQEAFTTGVSFIPVIGPVLGPGVSVGETLNEALSDRRSWLAALMVLRRDG